MKGGCIWITVGRQLHDSFSGSQLKAAITFLNAHPGQVSPITLNLGGNDIPNLVTPCIFNNQIDLACVRDHAPAFIADLAGTISGFLDDLRSAAPDAEIILMGSADTSLNALAFADPLIQLFNKTVAQAAAANRAWFADPFPVFNPQGNLAAEVQTLCTLTLLCSQSDIHPSDAGYQALARIVFDASQYARLAE
jgi:lysophospholipase L1-like esterase